MSRRCDPRFLALLVHRGLLGADAMKAALASGDPFRYLTGHGLVSTEEWERWERTDAGRRPELTRYELGEQLGEGGAARVFAAVDRKTGQQIALKILKSEVAADPEALAAFVRESKLLIELDCPHIVKGLRVAREGDVYFCAMERIRGVCLQERVAHGRLDERRALDVVMQVGRALAYLHARGLVHRDVKPGNIMLCDDGRAVLIDLGFAVAGGAPSPAESDTTAGTVHYISPEQARGQAGLDVRADIYSLGATLYHLVTGAPPFDGTTHEEVMAKQVREALGGEAIRALQLSPQVHYFIEKMMAKEKEIRFQSPEQLVDEIGHYLARLDHEKRIEEEELKRRKSRRRLRRFM